MQASVLPSMTGSAVASLKESTAASAIDGPHRIQHDRLNEGHLQHHEDARAASSSSVRSLRTREERLSEAMQSSASSWLARPAAGTPSSSSGRFDAPVSPSAAHGPKRQSYHGIDDIFSDAGRLRFGFAAASRAILREGSSSLASASSSAVPGGRQSTGSGASLSDQQKERSSQPSDPFLRRGSCGTSSTCSDGVQLMRQTALAVQRSRGRDSR